MVDKTKVSIQKISNNDINGAVFNSLELINADNLITKKEMKFLIKPNILMPKTPEHATTTHPEVLRAVIQWIKQFAPSKIYVCDSSGGQSLGLTEKAMKVSGILKVCEEEGATCVPFEKTERYSYQVKNPLELNEIISSNLFNEVDFIVNIPKIKTHWQCTLTCCIKNMFGTLILGNKARTHAQAALLDRFSAALSDIYSTFTPNLTIVDGYLCQEGKGPSNGEVVKMDLILAGIDGVALDTVVCKIIDINPNQVKYLEKAVQKDLGTNNLNEIEILGESIENVYRKFKLPRMRPISVPLPKFISKYAGRALFRAMVKFDSKKCRLCGTCWNNCPVNAINPPDVKKKQHTPQWNRNRCITCYCCAELCPYDAVDFKINLFKNILFSYFGLGLIIVLLSLSIIIFVVLNL